MLFGSTKKRYQKTPIVIFDIGSASVAGALVLLSPENPPLFLSSIRQWIRQPTSSQSAHTDRLASALESAIESVATDIIFYGKKRLSRIGYNGTPNTTYCFVSSPWYIPHTRTIKIKSPKPFKVTELMLSHAALREKKSLEAHIKDSDTTTRDFKVMENQILSCSINGYEAKNPYGKNARDLEFLLYTTFAKQDILNRFSSRIEQAFNLKDLRRHSFLVAFFNAMRDIAEDCKDFLLVDVSGEATEVSLVRNGKLLSSASFSMGRNAIIREVAVQALVSPEEALSFLPLYFSDKAGDKFLKHFTPTLKEVERAWMKNFEKSISHILEEAFLPHTIFVAADDKIAPLISRAIKNEELHQHTLTEKPFVVNILNEKMLNSFAQFAPGVTHDSLLVVDALFANKL